MNIFGYALFSYALMAVISLVVVAIIVVLNKMLNKPGKEEPSDD